MTAERTTARLDMHGQRHEAPCAQGPHLAYLSADRRFACLTVPGQRVLDGVLALFALGGVQVCRAYQMNNWQPIEACGLDPQLVAPPLAQKPPVSPSEEPRRHAALFLWRTPGACPARCTLMLDGAKLAGSSLPPDVREVEAVMMEIDLGSPLGLFMKRLADGSASDPLPSGP